MDLHGFATVPSIVIHVQVHNLMYGQENLLGCKEHFPSA